jgi:protein-S-isoprenylcysteine O-methyltransferase Ste14
MKGQKKRTGKVQLTEVQRKDVVLRLITVLVVILLQGGVLFAAAGRLDWGPAWAYIAAYLATIVLNALTILPKNADLIAERARRKSDAKGWDRYLAASVGFYGPTLMLLTAGLDERYGWTGYFPMWAELGGLILVAAGFGFVSWSMKENKFFSGVVRIQMDRGHKVASGGPYRIVRHPGYLGMSLTAIGAPVLLSSSWAFIPASLTIILLVIRTALEDRTLQDELKGYKAYTKLTRYRLIPRIW